MERKDYLTTGELTQLMGITKHTLFHYDDIGLFQPKYINEKGYRFYSIDQIDILNTILVLRDLDMPLKEIQTYVSQRTPELFQQIFLEHEAQIAKQIKKLQSMKNGCSNRETRFRLRNRPIFQKLKSRLIRTVTIFTERQSQILISLFPKISIS